MLLANLPLAMPMVIVVLTPCKLGEINQTIVGILTGEYHASLATSTSLLKSVNTAILLLMGSMPAPSCRRKRDINHHTPNLQGKLKQLPMLIIRASQIKLLNSFVVVNNMFWGVFLTC